MLPKLPTTNRLTLFLARLLGERLVTKDAEHRMTWYRWRGRLYLVAVDDAAEDVAVYPNPPPAH